MTAKEVDTCVSCGTSLGRSSVQFKCPACGAPMGRCGKCRQQSNPFICPNCKFQGP